MGLGSEKGARAIVMRFWGLRSSRDSCDGIPGIGGLQGWSLVVT